eukprot:6406126-Amphidinium_carterae.1
MRVLQHACAQYTCTNMLTSNNACLCFRQIECENSSFSTSWQAANTLVLGILIDGNLGTGLILEALQCLTFPQQHIAKWSCLHMCCGASSHHNMPVSCAAPVIVFTKALQKSARSSFCHHVM